MVVLSAQQMESAYIAERGPNRAIVAWLSVALAESGWDTLAISPADARGLYQIEPFNFPATGLNFSNWTSPNANTRAMVILSGGGVNFAPWDTAYANIGASGRFTFLGWPQRGSAAWDNMPRVAAEIGQPNSGGANPPPQPMPAGGLPDALAWYDAATKSVIPRLAGVVHGISGRARRSYL